MLEKIRHSESLLAALATTFCLCFIYERIRNRGIHVEIQKYENQAILLPKEHFLSEAAEAVIGVNARVLNQVLM